MSLTIQPNPDGSLTITCEGTTMIYGGAPIGSPPPRRLPPQPDPQGPTSWPAAYVVRAETRGLGGVGTLSRGARTVQWAATDSAAQLRFAIGDLAEDTAYYGSARPRIRVQLAAGKAVDVGEIVAAVRRANSPIAFDLELVIPGTGTGDLAYDLDLLKR